MTEDITTSEPEAEQTTGRRKGHPWLILAGLLTLGALTLVARIYGERGEAWRVGMRAHKVVCALVNMDGVPPKPESAPPVRDEWMTTCRSSTAFFNKAIEGKTWRGSLGVIPDDLVIHSPRKNAGKELNAEENIWCVAMLGEENTQDTPFMFTRNVAFAKKPPSIPGAPPVVRLTDMTGLSSRVRPFGSRWCVVVTWGGSVRVLSGKDLKDPVIAQFLFNPSGASNVVLFP